MRRVVLALALLASWTMLLLWAARVDWPKAKPDDDAPLAGHALFGRTVLRVDRAHARD